MSVHSYLVYLSLGCFSLCRIWCMNLCVMNFCVRVFKPKWRLLGSGLIGDKLRGLNNIGVHLKGCPTRLITLRIMQSMRKVSSRDNETMRGRSNANGIRLHGGRGAPLEIGDTERRSKPSIRNWH